MNAANTLRHAELDLSLTMQASYHKELFRIAPNPFEQGRANEVTKWRANYAAAAKSLVWC